MILAALEHLYHHRDQQQSRSICSVVIISPVSIP